MLPTVASMFWSFEPWHSSDTANINVRNSICFKEQKAENKLRLLLDEVNSIPHYSDWLCSDKPPKCWPSSITSDIVLRYSYIKLRWDCCQKLEQIWDVRTEGKESNCHQTERLIGLGSFICHWMSLICYTADLQAKYQTATLQLLVVKLSVNSSETHFLGVLRSLYSIISLKPSHRLRLHFN